MKKLLLIISGIFLFSLLFLFLGNLWVFSDVLVIENGSIFPRGPRVLESEKKDPPLFKIF